jgi:hypothetical protein
VSRAAFFAVAIALAALPRSAWPWTGLVVDALTAQPVEGAVIACGDELVTTDRMGTFQLRTAAGTMRVRAIGYRRAEVVLDGVTGEPQRVPLAPFRPKALYLSFFGIGDRRLLEQALALIDATELNAVVIDVKGDHGKIPYASAVPLAAAVGAQDRRIIGDIKGLMNRLHEKGLYTIARIVVFKDLPLAQGRPGLAVRTRAGVTWRDRENLAWTDPFRREVWEYNVDIAVEAAQNGFDEIQFDYVRFPDAPGLVYALPSTQSSRVGAVVDFLAEARRRLAPYNVFLSADVFGYVCWNLDDTTIGQRLEDLAPVLDYISPMLYPSSFQYGIPGCRLPVAHPYEIVYRSLERAQERTRLPATRFRPWLQAFRDYGFDRRAFGGAEIRAQITAAERFGSDGWMLWNSRNVYSPDGLESRMRP